MDAVEVRIWGMRAGVVAREPASGRYAFEYYPDWAARQIELAPIMMPVAGAQGRTNRRLSWTFTDLGEGFRGLPGLVADALPDSFGNSLIEAYMQAQGKRPGDVTLIDRLAYMAKRSMGALEFRPPKGPAKDAQGPLDMAALVEEARRAVHGAIGSEETAPEALRDIIRVGTSAGGARPKAVIAWNPMTHEIRSGQFDVPKDFEHWLLKFDGVAEANAELGTPEGYGRIEYAYSLMARQAGIEMTECRLLEENGRAHFMTKRFDRDGSGKHHLQTLCALQHLDYKQARVHAYEQLFATIDAIVRNPAEQEKAKQQAFRRMVFNYMAANHDDHTKNFAFLMRQGGGWELTPAYDVTYAYKADSDWVSAHQMSVRGKFAQVEYADLYEVARRFSVPGSRALFDEVKVAVSQWGRFAELAQVPPDRAAMLARKFTLTDHK